MKKSSRSLKGQSVHTTNTTSQSSSKSLGTKKFRIAVVASGWHYPTHFYEAMVRQKRLDNMEIEFFCISHRDPSFAMVEKKGRTYGRGLRAKLDRTLYKEIASANLIEALGWNYKEYPNTIGDWGNSNQWLEDHNYKAYDLLLFTHDDNLIIHDRLFADVVEDGAYADWDILTNSPGMPQGYIRGSFEFFKPSALTKLGGKFDLSEVTLDRTGVTTASEDIEELFQWNAGGNPTNFKILELGLKVGYLSPAYRVSAYCIEGERGYISNTHGMNTEYEDAGLKYLHDNKII